MEQGVLARASTNIRKSSSFGSKAALSVPKLGSLSNLRATKNLSVEGSKTNLKTIEDLDELTESQEFRISLAKRKSISGAGDQLFGKSKFNTPNNVFLSAPISVQLYSQYFFSGNSILFLVVLSVLLWSGQGVLMTADWWLSKWTSMPSDQQRERFNLYLYVGLASGTLFIAVVRAVAFFSACLCSSKNLFSKMMGGVLFSPYTFFQSNTMGNIMRWFWIT
jgi:hypothetical protein